MAGRPKKLLLNSNKNYTKEEIIEKERQEAELDKFSKISSEPPEFLDEIAKEEYRRIIPHMQELPISTLDQAQIAQYCSFYSDFVQASELITKTGGVVIETEKGSKVNPAFTAKEKAGTLDLTVDDTGLKYRCKLPNTTFARDLYENMRVGNINQCSFGFMLDADGDEMRFDEKENIYKRTLKAIRELTDVSVVTYPAYKDTDVKPAIRSIENFEHEKRKNEIRQRLEKMKTR